MSSGIRKTIVMDREDLKRIQRIAKIMDVSVSWIMRQIICGCSNKDILNSVGRLDLLEKVEGEEVGK